MTPSPSPLSSAPRAALVVVVAAIPLGSIVVIVGGLVSNWWITVPGVALMVGGYAGFCWFRSRPTSAADLLFGWVADPRPAPRDVVDRPSEEEGA